MKKRIKEIEEIAAALREICDKVEKKMDADQGLFFLRIISCFIWISNPNLVIIIFYLCTGFCKE